MTKRKITPKTEAEPKVETSEPVAGEAETPTVAEAPAPETSSAATAPTETPAPPQVDWQSEALRLQAEMQTFRRRQEQRADFLIREERQKLLRKFLEVADNLEQALKLIKPDDPVHRGVKTTYDALMNLLRIEGVTPIEAKGHPFDPTWHEAVTMLPAPAEQEEELLVLEELQRGYRLNDQVLRPARVVVSQKG